MDENPPQLGWKGGVALGKLRPPGTPLFLAPGCRAGVGWLEAADCRIFPSRDAGSPSGWGGGGGSALGAPRRPERLRPDAPPVTMVTFLLPNPAPLYWPQGRARGGRPGRLGGPAPRARRPAPSAARLPARLALGGRGGCGVTSGRVGEFRYFRAEQAEVG